MDILQTSIMGVVQGLSEFLPVSSSAHLVFTADLYNHFTGATLDIESSEEVFLDIMLHLGTLFAVLMFFKQEVIDLTKGLINGIKTKDFKETNASMALYIIIGTIFTLLVAFPLKDFTEELVDNPIIVGILLVITGTYLLVSEYISKKFQDKDDKITLKRAILMGIAQGLAAFPGFSRSGWTIATGLCSKLNRVTAAKFSFLLSIPIILGTSMVYPLLEIDLNEILTYNWVAIIIGTIISWIVGYFCIKYFLKFLAKFSLAVFAYYCIILGAGMAIFFKFFT